MATAVEVFSGSGCATLEPMLRVAKVLLLGYLTCSALGLAQSAQPAASSAVFEQCLNLNEKDLRSGLRTLTRQFFSAELSAVDLPRMVENKWLELGLPDLLETEVNRAVESVRQDTGLTRRLTSSFSPAQATELAQQIANRAFTSEALRTRLETLAGEVADDFTQSFTSVAARSASSATECVQTYLGNTYGNAVVTAYGQEIQAQVEATGTEALTKDFQPDILGVRSGVGVASIAGGYVARAVARRLSTQISRRVAGNIAARILGRAGSSVIPVIGWAVGGGLIAIDVVDSAVRGPFPAIRRQLAGDETQQQIQTEIVTSLRETTPTVSTELSAGIANEVFTQWQSFTQNFRVVLDLARRNAAFRQDLGKVPDIDLYKLAEVVRSVSERAVLEATRKGELRRVVELPESALEILETSASITTVLAWADLAGTRLDDVVNTEVYRYKAPTDFSQRTLTRLLNTDNVVTIAEVAALPKQDMDTLLAMPTTNLNALTGEFNPAQLQTVAWYAGALNQEPFNMLVTRLVERPSRLEKFAPETVRNAVVNSREPLTAVVFLDSEPSFGLFGADFIQEFSQDLMTVSSRAVSSRLLLAKYGLINLLLLLAVLLAVLLILLILLTRPFRKRRRS